MTNGVVVTFRCNHTVCFNCFYKSSVLSHNQKCPICKIESKVIFVHHLTTKAPVNQHFDNVNWFKEKQLIGAYVEKNKIVTDLIQDTINPPCQICGEQLISFQELQTHVQDKHNLFYCHNCVKAARFIPSEQKLYDRQQLTAHIKTHIKCPLCKLNFYDDEDFKQHLQVHRKCELCKEMYGIIDAYLIDDKALKEHYKNYHITCQYTGCQNNMLAFQSRLDLAKHMLSEHEQTLSAKEIVRWQKEIDDQEQNKTIDLGISDQYTQQFSLKALMQQGQRQTRQQIQQQNQEQQPIVDELGHHFEAYIEPPVQQYRGLVKSNRRNNNYSNQDHLTDDTAQNVQSNQQYNDSDDIIIKTKKQRIPKRELRKQIQQDIQNNQIEQNQMQDGQTDFLSDIMGGNSGIQNQVVQNIKQPGIQIQVNKDKQEDNTFNIVVEDELVVKQKPKNKRQSKQQWKLQYEQEKLQSQLQVDQQYKQTTPQQEVQQVKKQEVKNVQYLQICPAKIQSQPQKQEDYQNDEYDDLIVKNNKKQKKSKLSTQQLYADYKFDNEIPNEKQEVKQEEEQPKQQLKQYINIQATDENKQYKQRQIEVPFEHELEIKSKKQQNKQKQPSKQQKQDIPQPQVKYQQKVKEEKKKLDSVVGDKQFIVLTTNVFNKQLNMIVCNRYIDNYIVEELIWTENELSQIKDQDVENYNIQDLYQIKNTIQLFQSQNKVEITNVMRNKCKVHQFYNFYRKNIPYIFILNKQDQQILQSIGFEQSNVIRLPSSVIDKNKHNDDINLNHCQQILNQININQIIQKYDIYQQKYDETKKTLQQQEQQNNNQQNNENSDTDLPPGLF